MFRYAVLCVLGLAVFAAPQSSAQSCGSITDTYKEGVSSYFNGTETGVIPPASCQTDPPPLGLGFPIMLPGQQSAAEDGEQYQCVELIRRFYREAKNTPTSGWTGKHGDAQEFFLFPAYFGLVAYKNGGATAPALDDVVGFVSADGFLGHVAIIKQINDTGGAQFTVDLFEQNTNQRHQLTVQRRIDSNGNIAFFIAPRCAACLEIQGWMRLPTPPSASGSTAIIAGTVNGQMIDKAYIPVTPQERVAVLNADATTPTGALLKSIQMPSGFLPDATAADAPTQQVIVVSYSSPQVQIIDASQDKLISTLNAPVTASASFSGGACMICGVLVDPNTNTAILDTAQGYLLLNMTNLQFSGFVKGTVAGENFGYNQNSRTVLNPTYSQGIGSALQAISLTNLSVWNFNSSVGSTPDSVAFDANLNWAIVPDEFTGNQYLINMGQAVFSSASSTFSAPSSIFPLTFTTCGSELHDWSLVSVESSSHLLFLGTEFADCAAIEALPTLTVSGPPPLPTVFHWGHMPTPPDGAPWNNGGDPHGIAVFTSVVNGKAYGFLIRYDKAWVARLDLAGLVSAPLKPGGGLNEVDLSPYVTVIRTQ